MNCSRSIISSCWDIGYWDGLEPFEFFVGEQACWGVFWLMGHVFAGSFAHCFRTCAVATALGFQSGGEGIQLACQIAQLGAVGLSLIRWHQVAGARPVEPVFRFKEAAAGIIPELELLSVVITTESLGDVGPHRVRGPRQLPADDLARKRIPPDDLPPNLISDRLSRLQHPQILKL
jgi:hypothetical protein